jgi:hypothetical protein
MNGVKWHENQKTLWQARNFSNEVCEKYGVSIIENKSDKGKTYNEWKKAKEGKSWKDNLRRKIDLLVADDEITTIDNLLGRLQADGCAIRRGKYISVKPPEAERAVRLYKLGNGYSEKQLEYRLEHKDKETSLASIYKRYRGISFEYALVIRQVELTIYKKRPNPKRWNYKNLMDGAELLNFLSENQITSYEQFGRLVENETAKTCSLLEELEKMKTEQTSMEKIFADGKRYFDLFDKSERTDEDNREIRTLMYIGKYNIWSKEKLDAYGVKLESFKEQILNAEKEYNEQKAKSQRVTLLFERYNRELKDDYTKVFEQVRAEQIEAEQIRRELERKRDIDSGYDVYYR